MDLRFGPLLQDDLPALLDLWVESWSHVYPGVRFDDRREWFDGHLASWLDAGWACRVARAVDGRLVGFVPIDPAKAHLDQICVAHDLKGGGCGLALMRDAQRLSPHRIDLSVSTSFTGPFASTSAKASSASARGSTRTPACRCSTIDGGRRRTPPESPERPATAPA